MKKLLVAISMLYASTMLAEGFQVNLQSTKQAGMAHTGTAMRLGAESMHFNPAGLVYMNKSVDLSVGGSAVITDVKYNDLNGYTAKTNNKVSTPFYAYAGFNIYDKTLAAGICVTTPYGSSLDWGKDWKGATAVQDIALRSFVFQPTVSVQIVEGLSFGAGMMIATGSFDLSRAIAMINEKTITGVDQPAHPLHGLYGLPAVSATLSGGSNIRLGYNLGLMYQLNDKFNVGLTYRSKIKMKVDDGTATMDYLNSSIEGLLTSNPKFPQLNKGTFRAELPLPSNTTLGLCFTPDDRWTIAFDLQYTNWKAYKQLAVNFSEEVLDSYSIVSQKNYRSTFTYRLGAQYMVTDRLDVRAGIYFDESPVRSDNYNPETPGANKSGFCAGFTFKPYKNLCIDVAFTFIDGEKRYGSYTNIVTNVVTGAQTPDVFAGRYKSTAFIPSFGVSYKF